MAVVNTERCESCGAARGERHKVVYRPTEEEIEEWLFDSLALATDGCEVEPDGHCEHGHQSWLLRLGVI